MMIFDCRQGTPEWFKARLGIPTASEFGTVMASGKDGGDSKTRRTYMLKLAGEIITGEPADSYSNAHMERGTVMEDEARDYYAVRRDVVPERVGFIRNGDAGCSPDSLIGEASMLEIKTALPHILIEKILKDGFPPEHKAQCQGALWIAEREEIEILVYWPKMRPFLKLATRDEPYIKTLSDAVAKFNDELLALVDQVRRHGDRPDLMTALRKSVELAPPAKQAVADPLEFDGIPDFLRRSKPAPAQLEDTWTP